MLRMRLLVAALLLLPLIGLLVVDFHWSGKIPGIWLLPLGIATLVLTTEEVIDLVRSTGRTVVAWPVYTGVVAIFGASYLPGLWILSGSPYPVDCPLGRWGWPLVMTVIAVGLVVVQEIMVYQGAGGVVDRMAAGCFVIIYAALPFCFLTQLRLFHDNRWGMAALVSVVFVTKLSDVGAYASGRLWGRAKMCPRLSPNKTWVGAMGGVVAAGLAAWCYFQWLTPLLIADPRPHATWWGALLFGGLLAIAGIVGDLSASMLKRDAARKNSSSWMPGLGGVLDVVDSLLMATLPAYLCWAAGIVGPGS